MKRDYSRMVFKHVLAWLRDKDMPTSKIPLQKALFFLQEKGVSLGYSFEPYSYGPFSRQIMEAASELERSGELTVRRTEYEPGPEFADTLSEKEKQSIDTYLDRFAELLGHELSFDKLELFGTALYCIQALKENGMAADKRSVVREFKEWKGGKFPERSIAAAYDALAGDFFHDAQAARAANESGIPSSPVNSPNG